MTQAIGAGNGPDVGLVVLHRHRRQVLLLRRLGRPQARTSSRDNVDLNKIPSTVRSYTEFHGKRCAMPFLADAYGLYYNKDMFAEGRHRAPPKTLGELTEDAKKLTVRKRRRHHREGRLPAAVRLLRELAGAPGPGGRREVAHRRRQVRDRHRPGLEELLTWQKDLVDWYGYKNLEKFRAGLGDEFSADNAFQKGQVAMNVDGEYRIAFLKDQAPEAQVRHRADAGRRPQATATAPATSPATSSGISKNAKNPEAAWALIKYLTTDTDAIVKLANGIKNVPTTTDALAAARTCRSTRSSRCSSTSSTTRASRPRRRARPARRTRRRSASSCVSWQSGSVKDLDAGLADVDKQINQLIELAG